MTGLDWDAIQRATGGSWAVAPTLDHQAPIGAAIDTRDLKGGQMFVAYVGAQVDGHAYLIDAQRLGASMCLVTKADLIPEGFSIPVLVVQDATEAMTALARAWRAMYEGTVVGVTGSNGKTTTTRLMHAVLSQQAKSWVSSKSHNNAIGVPMSILNTPLDAGYAIFEIGTSSPGEIAARSELVRPDIGVITSIGRAHLEEFGTVSGVCKEKSSMLPFVKSLAIIPEGIQELDQAIDRAGVSCAIQRQSGSQITQLEMDNQSVSFTLDGSRFTATVPGAHNASNASLAIMVGRAVGMEDDQIAQGLAGAALPEMRLDRVEIPTGEDPIVLYNDAYNANPDSTRAAIAFFGTLSSDSSRVVVLGDMLELGASANQEHESLLLELDPIKARYICVGDSYTQAIRILGLDGIESFAAFDLYTMTEIARSIKPGDLVLLKGSRGIGLERLVYILINRHTPFAGAGTQGTHEDSTRS